MKMEMKEMVTIFVIISNVLVGELTSYEMTRLQDNYLSLKLH